MWETIARSTLEHHMGSLPSAVQKLVVSPSPVTARQKIDYQVLHIVHCECAIVYHSVHKCSVVFQRMKSVSINLFASMYPWYSLVI